jgi:hypothetical protein
MGTSELVHELALPSGGGSRHWDKRLVCERGELLFYEFLFVC